MPAVNAENAAVLSATAQEFAKQLPYGFRLLLQTDQQLFRVLSVNGGSPTDNLVAAIEFGRDCYVVGVPDSETPDVFLRLLNESLVKFQEILNTKASAQ
ncbi:MAG: hypothetical protein C5B44_05640 [Acidobacteria bacterium]|nr:MAG: hypothetical protein C5B44_05640 [Acidobacteriota bacterium]